MGGARPGAPGPVPAPGADGEDPTGGRPRLPASVRPGPGPRPDWRPRPVEAPLLTPMRLVKWILAVLVLGPLFWWVYSLLVRPNYGVTGTAP